MARIISSTPASITTGAINVGLKPDDPASQSIITGETTTTFTIPAGTSWVKIRNAGFVQQGDLEAIIQVNGSDWSVGREEVFECKRDTVLQLLKLNPSFAIVANGSRVFYSYAT